LSAAQAVDPVEHDDPSMSVENGVNGKSAAVVKSVIFGQQAF
jgi:hypothetical protein